MDFGPTSHFSFTGTAATVIVVTLSVLIYVGLAGAALLAVSGLALAVRQVRRHVWLQMTVVSVLAIAMGVWCILQPAPHVVTQTICTAETVQQAEIECPQYVIHESSTP